MTDQFEFKTTNISVAYKDRSGLRNRTTHNDGMACVPRLDLGHFTKTLKWQLDSPRLVQRFLRKLRVVIMLCAGIASMSVFAQQQVPSTGAEAGEAAPATTTSATGEPAAKTDPAPTSSDSNDIESVTRFSPTEKIRADDAVPLPVDI